MGAKIFLENDIIDISKLIKDILNPYIYILDKIVAIVTQNEKILMNSLSILKEEGYFKSNPIIISCFADTLSKCLKAIINKYTNEDPSFFISLLQAILSQFQSNLPLVNTWINQLKKPELTIEDSSEYIFHIYLDG